MSTQFSTLLELVSDPEWICYSFLFGGLLFGLLFSAFYDILRGIGNCLRYLAKYIKRKYEQGKEK